MTWTSIFVPNIWPMAATLFLMALLAGYSWRRRSVPGALPFMISCLFTLLVIVGILMAELAVDADTRLVWQKFKNGTTAKVTIACQGASMGHFTAYRIVYPHRHPLLFTHIVPHPLSV